MSKKKNRMNAHKKVRVFDVIRCIGEAAGHFIQVNDGEMKKKKAESDATPNKKEDVMRTISFAGIPMAIISSRGSGGNRNVAEESAAHSMLDQFRKFVSMQAVTALLHLQTTDPRSPQIQAIIPLFRMIETVLDEKYMSIDKIGQYDESAVAKLRGRECRKRIEALLKEQHGQDKEVNKQLRELVHKEQQKKQKAEVITLSDDDDQEVPATTTILPDPPKISPITDPLPPSDQPSTSTQYQAPPPPTPPIFTNLPEKTVELRKNDAELLQKAEEFHAVGPDGCPSTIGTRTASFVFENVDFGEMQKDGKGPDVVLSQVPGIMHNGGGEQHPNRIVFEADDSSDDDSDCQIMDAPPTPRSTSHTPKRSEELVLNISRDEKKENEEEEGDKSDEDEEVLALFDAWSEGDEEETNEQAPENTDPTTSSDGEAAATRKRKRSSIQEAEDHRKMFKDTNGIAIEQIYDGESSHEKLMEVKKWPIDYEKTMIGVIYNESLARKAEEVVYKVTERSFESVKKLCQKTWIHYENNAQPMAVYKQKMDVRERLHKEFQAMLSEKTIHLQVTGSSVNGCGAYNSDIDMCLCIPTEKFRGQFYDDFRCEKAISTKFLKRIAKAIRNSHPTSSTKRYIKKTELIPAKVPIIKMVLQYPNQDLDIDINVNNIAGIYNSHLIHYYSLIDSRFPAMSLFLKHWAMTNGLLDAMNGMFNSYSLILLVIHYLQCGVRPAVLPNLQYIYPDKFDRRLSLDKLSLFGDIREKLPARPPNSWSIGELLIGFFNYYADFNFSRDAVSIRSAQAFPRSTLPRETANFMIFIEEPFDAINTARCVRRADALRTIKKAFVRACDAFNRTKFDAQDIKVHVIV